MRELNPEELQAYLANPANSPRLLDVREPWEYGICRIKGAELIPMRQIPQALGRLSPAEEIVVICHHGIRSRQVALFLERQGFSRVINLKEGVAGWARDVDPAMPTY